MGCAVVMLSEDINATMNNAVMTVRTARKKKKCSPHLYFMPNIQMEQRVCQRSDEPEGKYDKLSYRSV